MSPTFETSNSDYCLPISSRYKTSQSFLERARRVEPIILARSGILGGHPTTPSEYPVFADHANGAFVYDVDGHKFLDFILAFGSVVLGHCEATVDEAVIREIKRGISPSLITGTHIRLAEAVTECVPGAEMATFLRSGSDATAAAVRLSRGFTGRTHVLRWGYQGWHDWCAPRDVGVPQEVRNLTSLISYGDLERLEVALRTTPGGVACVIMMPFEIDTPPEGYLKGVKDLCHSYKTLLVFDEIRSGFRMDIGGAQSFFDTRADLAVFSKALGNGYAISAMVGPRRIMEHVSELSLSSVYFRSSEAMAAAEATIGVLRKGKVIPRLWQLGERFQSGVKKAAALKGIPAVAVGFPPMPYIRFGYPSEHQNLLAMRMLCNEMLNRNVLLHPNHHWFVCFSMQDSDIDIAISHLTESFGVLAASPLL